MFVLSQSDSYSWPVVVELPTDGGKTFKQTFDGIFKRLPQSRIVEIVDELSKEKSALQYTDVAREVLVGWSGVNDNSGEPVPFSQSALEKMLEIATVPSTVVNTFFASHSGAKRKN